MNKSFTWRIWMAVTLTSLGVLYYLVFLYYLCGGVPIEKIHYFMTDGWPSFCADNVPLVAPVFLFVGLYFWYSYTTRSKPKAVPEPTYDFHFKTVEKSPELQREPDHVFESRASRSAKAHASLTVDDDTITSAQMATPSVLVNTAPVDEVIVEEPPVKEAVLEVDEPAPSPLVAVPVAEPKVTPIPVAPVVVKPIAISAVTATRVTIYPAVTTDDKEV